MVRTASTASSHDVTFVKLNRAQVLRVPKVNGSIREEFPVKNEAIVPLVKDKIPTIVGFNPQSQAISIGKDARRMGLNGKTTVFNFKPAFGLGDKEFSRDKKYWYWVPETPTYPQRTETFTAKEAAQRFLQSLMAGLTMPERIIIGEPAVREQTWKENFRRHIRETFSEMGLVEPQFFPEPFAVFQYYRHVDKSLPVSDQAEIVLIVDIGGGTFNSCIIRTTEQGLLARGGATAVPLGLQADVCGGAEIDRELLRRVTARCGTQSIRWKEDPVQRVQHIQSPALLRVEDAKIYLSEQIALQHHVELGRDYSDIRIDVSFPKGELHPDQEVRQYLTGEDLKAVIRDMWRRNYGRIICDTVTEASKKLQSAVGLSLDKIDRVLVAGGSSRLPFMKEEILTVLPSLLDANNIYIGSDIGEAVAFGIALECREQAKRDPQLSVDKLSSCITSDLYLGFRPDRRAAIVTPKVRRNGTSLPEGRLLSAPFETDELIQSYEIELPFDVGDRLLYYFSDTPLNSPKPPIPLNLTHDIFSVPRLNKISRKCDLVLTIKPNGFIRPVFTFHGKGTQVDKTGGAIDCPEFYSQGFQIRDGKTYLGLDFGTSNSYLVKFISVPREVSTNQYPEFTLRSKVKEQLRELELRLQGMRIAGRLTPERLMEHARDKMLEVIFHSNKIEGNPLTKGETQDVLASKKRTLTDKEQEAKNLEQAYKWMLDNVESCLKAPESFVRHLNGLILKRIGMDGGEYRKGPVSLSGMDFEPPAAPSVPAFMKQLSEELQIGVSGRSPLECSASFHTKLVWIHPFLDGNGRTARLLLNAFLLSQGLPVLVINYADKERYLDCLKESNKGDLSALMEFVIDCFEEQIAELEPAGSGVTDLPVHNLIATVKALEEPDPIVAVLEEVGVGETDDPLAAIMSGKVLERRKTVEAEYEAWKQCILTLPAELKTIVEAFNGNVAYREAGYKIRCQEYDLLTFEKYLDIRGGRGVSKTWFLGLDMVGPQTRQKFMWFFNGASWILKQKEVASPVSLAISRFDGSRYLRLSSEPIGLREIGYRQGSLSFATREGIVMEGSVRRILQGFLADTIKSYL